MKKKPFWGNINPDYEEIDRYRTKVFVGLRAVPVAFTLIVFAVLWGVVSSTGGLAASFEVEATANPSSTPISTKVSESTPAAGPETMQETSSSCPLPVDIAGWSSKTRAKWYDLRLHCDLIMAYATEFDIQPELVAAVMMQESGAWAGAESTAGAIGLMQVMPFHKCASWDPPENVECGVSILADYVHGDGIRAGLAAYNAGVTGRDRYGKGWDFADIVLAIYERIMSPQDAEQ